MIPKQYNIIYKLPWWWLIFGNLMSCQGQEKIPRTHQNPSVKVHWEITPKIEQYLFDKIPLMSYQNLIIASVNGQLIAYDITKGDQVWNFGNYTQSSVYIKDISIHEHYIYFASYRKLTRNTFHTTIVKLNAKTGQVIWKRKLQPNDDFITGTKDLLLVKQGEQLICLRPSDGQIKWKITQDIYRLGKVYLYDNAIYSLHYDYDPDKTNKKNRGTYLTKINYKNGKVLWQKKLGKQIISEFSMYEGHLYFFDIEHIYCYNSKGDLHWKIKNKNAYSLPHSFGQNYLYLLSHKEPYYPRAIEPLNGRIAWSSSKPDGKGHHILYKSPIIYKDYLVLEYRHVAGERFPNQGSRIFLLNAKDGRFIKELQVPGTLSSPFLSYQGRLFYLDYKAKVYCISFD